MDCGAKPEGAMNKSIGRGLRLLFVSCSTVVCVWQEACCARLVVLQDILKRAQLHWLKVAFELCQQFLLYL